MSDPPDERSSSLSSVMGDGLPQAAALIGAVGGLLGLVYGIGGGVMWLRFHHQGLPADQAVALMPKADLLVVGMRVMVLPAILTGLVLVGLASIRHARAREFDRLTRERGRRVDELGEQAAEDPRIAAIDERLGRLRERPRPLDALPAPARRPARVVLALLVVALALVVPFSIGAFAWPVVLVALVWYWLRLRRDAPIGSGRNLPIWRIAVAGVLAAATISVARQTDPPVQLPSVQAVVTGVPELRSTLVLDPARAAREDAPPVAINGVLVMATDDQVAIGDPARGTIVTVPRSHVNSMIVGPALDLRAPPRSLLSRALGGEPGWAVTPLEVWCRNERYSWTRVADLCAGHARVRSDRLALVSGGAVSGVRVECPQEASGATCRGFFTLQTVDTAQALEGGRKVVASTLPAPYAVTRGDSAEIKLRVSGDFVRRHWPRSASPVRVRVLLTLDAMLEAVLFKERRKLFIGWTPRKPARDEGNEDGGTSGPTGPTSTPSAGQSETPTSTPTPTPTASPTPEPQSMPVQPPSDEPIPIPTAPPEAAVD